MTVETANRPRIWQKDYLPPGIDRHNTDVAQRWESDAPNIARFPMGDIDNFSVGRACYAMSLRKAGKSEAASWDHWAPWEKQYLSALRDVTFKAQGDQVSGIDGGYLAPEYWSRDFFGLLRSFSALDQLPIQRFNVPIRLARIPVVSNDITVSYGAENAAGPTATQFQFGQVSYTPRKATAILNVPNELMRDAPGTVDQMLQSQGAEAIAVDRDNQALNGTGQGLIPVGLTNNPQVSKYYVGTSATAAIQAGANHGTPSLLHLSQLRSKVTNLNASANVTAGQARCTGLVAHSRFEQTVHSMAAAASPWTDAQGRPFWLTGLNGDGGPSADGGGKGSLLGLSWAFTNVLPTTSTDGGGTLSSYIIAGYWQRYVLWECLALGFDATPFGQGFGADQTQIRLVHRWDGGPANPESFAVLAGCDQ